MDPKVLFLDDLIGVVVKPTMLMVEPDRLGNPNLQDWAENEWGGKSWACLLYTSPSPRDRQKSRMPSSA